MRRALSPKGRRGGRGRTWCDELKVANGINECTAAWCCPATEALVVDDVRLSSRFWEKSGGEGWKCSDATLELTATPSSSRIAVLVNPCQLCPCA